MSELKPGARLRSPISTTEIIVTMGGEGILTCGGATMVPPTTGDKTAPPPRPPSPGEGHDETLLGKRYTAPFGAFQVLCTRQGSGALELDGVRLELMKPKLLPASD